MIKESTIKDREANAKLRKALLDLLIYGKLAGLVLLGEAVQIEEREDITTMATDGRSLFYAPSWVRKKPKPSIMFDLLHEFLHIFGNHAGRRGTRDRARWNTAADIRVAHDALRIMRAKKPDWQLDADHVPAYPWAADLTVEQIHDLLPADQAAPKNEDLLDPAPEKKTQVSQDQFLQKFTENLAMAAAAVEVGGESLKDVYGSMVHDRLKELLRGSVPWGRLLQGRLIGALGHDTAVWLPPNRRWFPEIMLPSRRATHERELLLGVDISASVTQDLINKFASELKPALQRARKTTVVTFDAVIRETVEVKDPRRVFDSIKFASGSHSYTSVVPLFELVDARRFSAVAILTDGHVRLPARRYPDTHWIVPRGGATLPWGHHYTLEFAW